MPGTPGTADLIDQLAGGIKVQLKRQGLRPTAFDAIQPGQIMEAVMLKNIEVKGNLQIDPYGHKQLSPRTGKLPEGSVFVAGAVVWLEAICTDESYWLCERKGKETVYSLWCELGDLGGEYRICAQLEPEADTNPEAVAKWLLFALWSSRVSKVMAMTLDHFDKTGLLTRSWLNEFTEAYAKDVGPKEVPEGAKLVSGEVFYESGELKYRGEQWQGIPHGQGTGYWKNGNVWCEGTFRNNTPQGECKVYFPDGSLKYEGNLEEGLPKGPGKEYFDNGQLRFDGIYGRQSMKFYYGQRIYIEGKLYNERGRILRSGKFK